MKEPEPTTTVQDARKTQKQFVDDFNSLADLPSYDHMVDVCYRQMKQKTELQERTITLVAGFYTLPFSEKTAKALLTRILRMLQKGHYSKFGSDDALDFALSALPDSMSMEWADVRKALMGARADGTG